MKKERLNIGRQTKKQRDQAVNEKCSKVRQGGCQGTLSEEAERHLRKVTCGLTCHPKDIK